jgi:hypothetical protein
MRKEGVRVGVVGCQCLLLQMNTPTLPNEVPFEQLHTLKMVGVATTMTDRFEEELTHFDYRNHFIPLSMIEKTSFSNKNERIRMCIFFLAVTLQCQWKPVERRKKNAADTFFCLLTKAFTRRSQSYNGHRFVWCH